MDPIDEIGGDFYFWEVELGRCSHPQEALRPSLGFILCTDCNRYVERAS